MDDNTLNNALGLPIIEKDCPTQIINFGPVPDNPNLKFTDDIDNARSTQYELIEKGQEALNKLILFAEASESPRAWEVVANLIKVTSDVANSLVDTSLKLEKLRTKNDTLPGSVTNNSIFVGSTAELQKLIKGDRGGGDDII